MHKNKILNLILISILFLCLVSCDESDDNPNSAARLATKEYLESINFSGSVLIRKNNQNILSRGFGYSDRANIQENTLGTRFRIGSNTKPFTALCIVLLQNDGRLSYDDPLSYYISDYPTGEKITIRHLVSQQSGLGEYLGLTDQNQSYTPMELWSLVKGEPLLFEPGSHFHYSNTNYLLLGMIIESLSGYTYASYVKTMITNPLGMFNTEYGSNIITSQEYAQGYKDNSLDELAGFHDMSIPYSAGALSSNISDMEIWADSFFDLTLISEQNRNDIFRGEIITELDKGKYGFGWFITTLNDKTVYRHPGSINGFNSSTLLFPEDESIVIVLCNVGQIEVSIQEISSKLAELSGITSAQ